MTALLIAVQVLSTCFALVTANNPGAECSSDAFCGGESWYCCVAEGNASSADDPCGLYEMNWYSTDTDNARCSSASDGVCYQSYDVTGFSWLMGNAHFNGRYTLDEINPLVWVLQGRTLDESYVHLKLGVFAIDQWFFKEYKPNGIRLGDQGAGQVNQRYHWCPISTSGIDIQPACLSPEGLEVEDDGTECPYGPSCPSQNASANILPMTKRCGTPDSVNENSVNENCDNKPCNGDGDCNTGAGETCIYVDPCPVTWEYKGCFDPNITSWFASVVLPQCYDALFCAKTCADASARYFALSAFNTCLCGQDIGSLEVKDDDHCHEGPTAELMVGGGVADQCGKYVGGGCSFSAAVYEIVAAACATANVGASVTESVTVYMDEEYTCPTYVNKDVWTTGDNWPDEFEVSQVGNSTTITRHGATEGWGMNLQFLCCKDDIVATSTDTGTASGSGASSGSGAAVSSVSEDMADQTTDLDAHADLLDDAIFLPLVSGGGALLLIVMLTGFLKVKGLACFANSATASSAPGIAMA